MANTVTDTGLPATRFVPSSSRYANSKVYNYNHNNITKLTFEIYKRPKFVVNVSDNTGVISPGSEYRPDLVSNDVYNTTEFWWKILEINGMKDIWEFKSGVTIRLPQDIF